MVLMRGIDADFLAAVSEPVWYPCVFLDIDWPSGRQRLHTAVGTLTWGGYDWTGIGNFGRASVPADSSGPGSVRMTLELFGILGDQLAALAAPLPRNRDVTLSIGALRDMSGESASLRGAPQQLFFGVVDAQRFKVVGEGQPSLPGYGRQHAMQLDVRDGPSPRRPQPIHHSAESQAAAGFASDTAGRHLIGMLKRLIEWPSV